MTNTPLIEALRTYLTATGQSARALSVAAGLGENAISDILRGRTGRPRPAVIESLAVAMGVEPASLVCGDTPSIADARAFLDSAPAGWSPSRLRGTRSALGCYARWLGITGDGRFDRATVRRFLTTQTPAAQGVSPETWSTYASHLRALLDPVARPARAPRIDDLTGVWRHLHALGGAIGLPISQQRAAAPFCVWCASRGTAPDAVTAATLVAWRDHRVAHGRLTMSEAAHTASAKRVVAWWNALAASGAAADLAVTRPMELPFVDRRRRYAASDGADAAFLQEFDTRLVPWLQGRTTPDGVAVDSIIDALDASLDTSDDQLKRAARQFTGGASRSRREALADRLAASGVLLPGRTWCPRRIANARSSLACMIRAFHAASGAAIPTIRDLTDPEIAEAAATALADGIDAEDLGSTYVSKLLGMLRKIAAGYVGRPAAELAAISALAVDFDPAFDDIAPRNLRKLRRFTPEKLQAFFGLSRDLVAEMNRTLEARRARIRRAAAAGEPIPPLMNQKLARQHAVVVAHDILCTRGPRSSTLLAIDTEAHVRRRDDGRIVIEIPPALVKNREPLVIVLSAAKSTRFQQYLRHARPLLAAGPSAGSTLLFPSTTAPDRPSTHLLDRLVAEVERRIGIPIHVHLYRHLIGWAWLREDRTRLPTVQKLLGHRRIETTTRFYARLDDELAQQDWSDFLERKADDAERAPRRAA